MSLIFVKLKLQMCKLRKGVLVFKIEYHVTKQPDYISILNILSYRKPQSFGDKVSNYSSPLDALVFLRGDPYYYIQK